MKENVPYIHQDEPIQGPSGEKLSGRVLTAEMFFDDNHSPLANYNRRIWKSNQQQGKMHGLAGCGDARPVITEPEKSYSMLSIAAGVSVYPELIRYPGVKDILVVTHFAGPVIPREPIRGCGGLQAAEELAVGENKNPQEGILRYVSERVRHQDAIVQSTLQAKEIAYITEKPVLASTQDHITGRVYPIAAYWRRNRTLMSAVSEKIDPLMLIPQNYSPEELYKDGMPSIDYETLGETGFDMFYEYIRSNQLLIARLAEKYPDLEERQKVQNPDVLVISTDLQPARLRYPKLFEAPGSYFKISVPRRKDITRNIRSVSRKHIEEVVNQAEYPISHAVEHHGDYSQPFSKVGTVFIETGDIELSNHLALASMEMSWMQEWKSYKDHHIIAAATIGGVITGLTEVI